MEKFILLIGLFCALPNVAQTNEIYGISRNNDPSVTYLAKANTTNGQIEDISNTSYSPYIANFSFTVDPYLGIYYYSGIDTFIGIDTTTGELIHENPITTSQLPIFQNFIYNEITGEIIGLERGGGPESGVYLSKIDPETGIVTAISTSSIANTFAFSGCAIDLTNQWYHLFSEGKILSVDIATGAVVHEPVVDISEFEFFNNLIYNAADGNLYAIGRNNDPAELFFIQINPITGVVNAISPTSLGEILALEGSTLDPYTGVYYFKRPFPISLVGVDIITGLEVSAIPFDLSASNGSFFGHFYFGGQTAPLLLSNDDLSKEPDVNIFPNPVENILHVDGNLISRITIYSITGQQLANWEYNDQEPVKLNVSSYNEGVYFLNVYYSQQEATILKFIKK
ncbi:T9SS type A sorting domain-containing protein [Patiriisocius sp. Uisw_017]|uniref:T9SS type A sorting domain-containing protein n=1 Tax=Patiriisocius sp. Uisw_017 TaxID=3230968 RepID=UPI0039EBE999